MTKVISTKLKVDELNRFTVIAEQQGKTKAGLLRRLILDCLNNNGQAEGVDPASRHGLHEHANIGLPAKQTSHNERLSSCQSIKSCSPLVRESPGSRKLVYLNRYSRTELAAPAPPVNVRIPGNKDVVRHPNSLTPSKDRLPVYRNDSGGRLKASNQSTTFKGVLFVLFLLWLRHKSQPSSTQ